MTTKIIPEIDVLIAATLWLHSRGYTLQTISVPRGHGIDYTKDKQKLESKLCEANIPLKDLRLKSEGPDIVAILDDCCWKIECKGLGKGKPATLRNNFDRAVASTVSYYDSKTDLRLGLALPKEYTYLNLIDKRIPQPLRETLDLWILLYNADTNSIELIEPTDSIPNIEKISKKRKGLERF